MCDFIRICSPYAAMHDTCLFLLFFTLTAPYKMFANQEIEFRKSVLINFRLIILFSRCLFAYTCFDSLSTRLPLTHHSFTAHSLLTHQLLTTYSLFTHHLLTAYSPLTYHSINIHLSLIHPFLTSYSALKTFPGGGGGAGENLGIKLKLSFSWGFRLLS